jgi:hypothetical protein
MIVKKMDDLSSYVERYDNLCVRSCTFNEIKKTFFALNISDLLEKISFRVVLQKNCKYRIITGKKSQISFPRRFSGKRFETPEEALDFLINFLIESGIKVYKSNAVNFILGITEEEV